MQLFKRLNHLLEVLVLFSVSSAIDQNLLFAKKLRRNDEEKSSQKQKNELFNSDVDLKIIVRTDGYPVLQSNNASIHGYPWKHIVEPYKTTVFEPADVYSVRTKEGFYYMWEIYDGDELIAAYRGDIAHHQFSEPTKRFNVSLRFFDAADNQVAINSEEVIVKYVRREVREYLHQDLILLMDTMQTLWQTRTEDGQALYGHKFKGIDYFNMKHINGGVDPECNHYHEGPGFINQHLALTLEFEQALQSINPSVTVPYWDFTIDAELYGEEWSKFSPVLDDDAFGRGLSHSYVLNKGRWAYTTLGDFGMYAEKTPFHNSYGLLRPEWNNNPYPYLTRWHQIAGLERTGNYPNDCNDYWQVLHDQTWSDFALDANTRAHGGLHGLLGGIWYEYKDWFHQGLTLPLGSGILFVKYFWRSGFLKCPKYCGPDIPQGQCRCHCDFGEKTWSEVIDSVNEMMSETVYRDKLSLFYMKASKEGYPEEFETIDDWIEHLFREMVCDVGSVGDNFDAESTHDPTFWTMHPTFERLQHWIRLSPEPYEYNWGVDKFSCSGHNPEDVIYFRNLFVDDEPGSGYYTNEEMYKKLDPSRDTLPYVYSNFEWPHCEELGFNMTNENLRSEYNSNLHKRPNDESLELSTVDWGLKWSEQMSQGPPSHISAKLRSGTTQETVFPLE